MPHSTAPLDPPHVADQGAKNQTAVDHEATSGDDSQTLDQIQNKMSGEPVTPVLVRISEGDSSAVQECIDQYGGLIWTLARRYCRTQADAEDVTQEIFVQLWKQASRFDPGVASEATFIATIARRRLIDHQRRIGRRREEVSETVFDSVDEWTPLNRVELHDDADKAAKCMEGLAKSQRDVLVLSISNGCSHTTISEKLSIPLGTVKSHARRALLQLRRCMGQPMVPSMDGGGS